jgi:hypothetical protein
MTRTKNTNALRAPLYDTTPPPKPTSAAIRAGRAKLYLSRILRRQPTLAMRQAEVRSLKKAGKKGNGKP